MSTWKVTRTIWPYKEGYGVYKRHFLTGNITMLDDGLTKCEAQEAANELNQKK